MKVAGVFFSMPTKKHNLKEISKESGLAHTSVKNYIEILKKDGIIREIKEKRGERTFPLYVADVNSESYRKQKIVNNVTDILASGLIDYLRDETMPNSIILFGSYSKGEDLEDSDVDLFVEAKEQHLDVARFESILKRSIQLHFRESINMCPKNLRNNIINGFTLFGSTEAFG